MTWAFVFGSASMDVVDIEIIDGKKHKIKVRNTDKLILLAITQFLFMLFFYSNNLSTSGDSLFS